MEISLFTSIISNNSNYIFRNYRNDSVVLLSSEEFNSVQNFLSANGNCKKSRLVSFLIKNKFLVYSQEEEKVDFLNELVQSRENDKFMCIHFLPTTKCNFICPYCYQNGINKS